MMIFLFFLILIGIGEAAYFGRTADSRDPEYSVGLLLAPREPN